MCPTPTEVGEGCREVQNRKGAIDQLVPLTGPIFTALPTENLTSGNFHGDVLLSIKLQTLDLLASGVLTLHANRAATCVAEVSTYLPPLT